MDEIEAHLGEHDTSKSVETEMVRMAIEEINNHPRYTEYYGSHTYDFSLLKMKKTIDFSQYKHIRPICLPKNRWEDYTGFKATVTGWGLYTKTVIKLSETLQGAELNVIKNSVCNNYYKKHKRKYKITSSMICARVDDGKKDACKFDSGDHKSLKFT